MGNLSKFIEEMGSKNAPQAPAYPLTPPEPTKPENDGIPSHCDPVSLAERVGIKYEQEIPDEKALGKPVFQYRGTPLAYENDPPHIRLYAWATVNLLPGRALSVDIEPVARLLGLSFQQAQEALSRLTKDGDLVRVQERGRTLYKLVINY